MQNAKTRCASGDTCIGNQLKQVGSSVAGKDLDHLASKGHLYGCFRPVAVGGGASVRCDRRCGWWWWDVRRVERQRRGRAGRAKAGLRRLERPSDSGCGHGGPTPAVGPGGPTPLRSSARGRAVHVASLAALASHSAGESVIEARCARRPRASGPHRLQRPALPAPRAALLKVRWRAVFRSPQRHPAHRAHTPGRSPARAVACSLGGVLSATLPTGHALRAALLQRRWHAFLRSPRCLAKARAGRPQRAWEAPGLRGSGAASAASIDN
jgi:hypothetical protein